MHLNYIVLAHKNPVQLRRLVERLDSAEARFYIHVDAPADISVFESALQFKERCIFLTGTQRLPITWGHVNMVKAVLHGINQILADQRQGYTVLLSGQDYPLKSNAYIQQFFQASYGTNFIECFPLPVTPQSAVSVHGGINRATWIQAKRVSGSMDRLDDYTFFFSQRKGDYAKLPPIFSKEFFRSPKNFRYAIGLLRRHPINFIRLFSKRKFPAELKPFGGSQWWALPYETILFLDQYSKTNPYFLEYNNFTLVPDEIFFQTLVANHFPAIAPPVTYANFMRSSGDRPATFTVADIQELTNNPCLFARKFDSDLDEQILNKLDEFALG